MLPDLLNQIAPDQVLGSVTADGAYDTRKCHDAVAARNAHAVIPPRKNAKMWKPEGPQTTFTNAIADLPFDAEMISGMDTANTQIAYSEAEFGGTKNFGAGSQVFWAGQLSPKAHSLHDLRSGYSDTFSADTMLWLIDGQPRGTLVMLQISAAVSQQ